MFDKVEAVVLFVYNHSSSFSLLLRVMVVAFPLVRSPLCTYLALMGRFLCTAVEENRGGGGGRATCGKACGHPHPPLLSFDVLQYDSSDLPVALSNKVYV